MAAATRVRITVAINQQQTTKAPLILPADAPFDPDAPKSCHSLVVKLAQTKLRVKKVQRIFVARTGEELCTADDWKRVLTNDVVLLVSAGEGYVGLKKDARQAEASGQANPECPIVNLAEKAAIDTQAIAQLQQTARTLPGLVHAVGQPDLHPGNKFPIGAVFVSEGWIHPPLIGGDIGCGMAWYRVNGLSRRQVDGDKGKKISERLRGVEGPWRTQELRESWLRRGEDCYSAGAEWDKSLGTIGAGNHFAELQVVESSSTDELKEDEVVLLVHSGSRGYGGDILKRYASDEEPSFSEDSPKARAYLEEHQRACEWAKANRDLIALRFLACLEPGNPDWDLGSGKDELGGNNDRNMEELRAKIESRKVVDIWHNNVEKIPWPPSSLAHEKSPEKAVSSLSISGQETVPLRHAYVHRKGAAPTYNPYTKTPLPILPLPGSRGTPTLILQPKFSEATGWGLHNAMSLAHGAGRSMSRAKALASLGSKYKNPSALLVPTTASQETKSANGEDVQGGTWVICDQKELIWEEAPEAYKDVYAVAEDLVAEGVAEIVGWCRARVSYKVRKE